MWEFAAKAALAGAIVALAGGSRRRKCGEVHRSDFRKHASNSSNIAAEDRLGLIGRRTRQPV
tara:strand:- start:53 stop:238 length:186 start_codon:yes stop_codon:yes gene_type:complete